MATLRLLETTGACGHQGEVYSLVYTNDGAFALSAGWDGRLRLWEASSGSCISELHASAKPLSCCAFSPDGKQWLSGSMEGMFAAWDGVSHQSLMQFVAHTRPISAITHSPEGDLLATASWDRQIVLRKVGKEREGRTLNGHQDIVTGCRFTLDGKGVVSWSHDGTVRLWGVDAAREAGCMRGHTDRVTCLALSPDGCLALSGGRDSTIRLWDLQQMAEVGTMNLGAEVRACFYLLDGESIVVADALGRLFLMQVPSFEIVMQLNLPSRPQCGAQSPSGTQMAIGCEDGRVLFVAADGLEGSQLVVAAMQNLKPSNSLFDRFLGKQRLTRTYQYTCPMCRTAVEAEKVPTQPVACPRCRRTLRVNVRMPLQV